MQFTSVTLGIWYDLIILNVFFFLILKEPALLPTSCFDICVAKCERLEYAN